VAGPIAREILDAYLLEDGELKPEFRYPQISEEAPAEDAPEIPTGDTIADLVPSRRNDLPLATVTQ